MGDHLSRLTTVRQNACLMAVFTGRVRAENAGLLVTPVSANGNVSKLSKMWYVRRKDPVPTVGTTVLGCAVALDQTTTQP